ncbi:O-methyltransferase [Kalaharituber pfeilii]|nr:O-methyltransferase [Kalaharituber pfeilii]
MQVLIHFGIFRSTGTKIYAHNEVSKLLTDEVTQAWMLHCLDESFKASSVVTDVLKDNNWKLPEEMNKAAFCKALQTDKSYFDYIYQENISMGERFSRGIGQILASGGPTLVNSLYPFNKLPSGTTIVDVGGGRGHISIGLARFQPHLNFIIQDYPSLVEDGKKGCPSELLEAKRILYMPHDMYQKQPVEGAVYFLRHILHDQPDPYSRIILQQLAASMNSTSSRILICDLVVKTEGIRSTMDVLLDLQMLSLLNSKERDRNQWESLIKSADESLELVKVWGKDGEEEGSCILEVRLKD